MLVIFETIAYRQGLLRLLLHNLQWCAFLSCYAILAHANPG